jgi:transcriptional regulator with XRE-family HTH domain
MFMEEHDNKRKRRSIKSIEENKINPNLKVFVTNLKKFRKEKGLTIRKLGIESDISFSTISEIESMISKPNFDTICSLSESLGKPIFLFFISDEEKI